MIDVETLFRPDLGNEQNVFNLDKSDLENRTVGKESGQKTKVFVWIAYRENLSRKKYQNFKSDLSQVKTHTLAGVFIIENL
jgi:hypothetical protein